MAIQQPRFTVSGNGAEETTSNADENPKLTTLLALWLRLRGGRALPARRAFRLEDLVPWLGHIEIVKVLDRAPPRLLVTLCGVWIVDQIGHDFTGECLDWTIPSSARAAIVEPYDRCIATHRPVPTRIAFGALCGNFVPLDQLLLPCGVDGARVDTIIGGIYPARSEPVG